MIVRRLNVPINKISKDPVTIKGMTELNMTDFSANTPEEFATAIQRDLKDYGSVVKATG